jgi:NAD(P)-dependent dehydrogenase (short-subunit alcohol dehydrogenase family)
MARTVLVTGGNRGIGLAIARDLAEAGDRVAVTYRSGEPPAGLLAVKAEMTDKESIRSAFEEVEAEFGRVEVLVANAGVTRDTPFLRMDEEAFRDVVDVNLLGAYRVARQAARGMLSGRWGRIVLVSSVIAATGAPGQANYSASKAGLTGLARSLAWELGPRGVTVNVVSPGLIDTDMSREISDRRREDLLRVTPVGRQGTVREVAAAVRFLRSEDSGFVTGAVLPVTGGLGMGF